MALIVTLPSYCLSLTLCNLIFVLYCFGQLRLSQFKEEHACSQILVSTQKTC